MLAKSSLIGNITSGAFTSVFRSVLASNGVTSAIASASSNNITVYKAIIIQDTPFPTYAPTTGPTTGPTPVPTHGPSSHPTTLFQANSVTTPFYEQTNFFIIYACVGFALVLILVRNKLPTHRIALSFFFVLRTALRHGYSNPTN